MVGPQKYLYPFPRRKEERFVTLTINLWQAISVLIPGGVSQVNIKPLATKPIQNLCSYVNITPLTANISCPWKINICHVKYYTSDKSFCFPPKSPSNSLPRNGRSTSSIIAMLTLYL